MNAEAAFTARAVLRRALHADRRQLKGLMVTTVAERLGITFEEAEELARMTKHGFDDVLERLDVRERIQIVEQKLQRIEEALHITL